jgi:hypothetical protein
LQYTGRHYLQFAGSGEYFLKLGADSPETLLAYTDFDGTVALKPQVPLHTFTLTSRTGAQEIQHGRAIRARGLSGPSTTSRLKA